MRATISLTGSVGPEDLDPDALEALMDVFDNFRREAPGDPGT
jgi:hypothetical protein